MWGLPFHGRDEERCGLGLGQCQHGKLALADLAGLPHAYDNETDVYQPTPTLVSGLAGHEVLQVACGADHSLAVTRSGAMCAWGAASYGTLGLTDLTGLPQHSDDETDVYQPEPALLGGLVGVCDGLSSITVAAGCGYSCTVFQGINWIASEMHESPIT